MIEIFMDPIVKIKVRKQNWRPNKPNYPESKSFKFISGFFYV